MRYVRFYANSAQQRKDVEMKE